MGAEIRASRTLLGGNSLTSNQDWTGRYKTESLADFLMKRFIGLSVEGKGREGLPSAPSFQIVNLQQILPSTVKVEF